MLAHEARQRKLRRVLLEAPVALAAAVGIMAAQALDHAHGGVIDATGRLAQFGARRAVARAVELVDGEVGDGMLDLAHGGDSE